MARTLPLLLVPALLSFPGAFAQEKTPVRDVSHALHGIREKHGLPGIAAVALSGGRIVAQGADGVRKQGEEAKITISDRFHLGSCTKSMTATMIATLVEDGKLAWTTTLGDVWGDLDGAMRPAWKSVTLEQLLTHRSGTPGDVPPELWARLWARRGTPTEQRMELVRGTLSAEPKSEPGTKFAYSNTGYAIAGAMAEKVAETAWEELMQERLFRPLSMESAGFGAPGRKGKLDEPLGHTAKGEPVEMGPGDDNPPAIGPGGTVHATLADWGRYVAAHLAEDEKLLEPATWAKLHAPVEGDGQSYAMGWGAAQRDWGGRVLTHSGSNTMWYCVVWMAPEKDFAVLVAANQGGDEAAKACDEAAGALIRTVLAPREPGAK